MIEQGDPFDSLRQRQLRAIEAYRHSQVEVFQQKIEKLRSNNRNLRKKLADQKDRNQQSPQTQLRGRAVFARLGKRAPVSPDTPPPAATQSPVLGIDEGAAQNTRGSSDLDELRERFDSEYYREQLQDDLIGEPWQHYVLTGIGEGRYVSARHAQYVTERLAASRVDWDSPDRSRVLAVQFLVGNGLGSSPDAVDRRVKELADLRDKPALRGHEEWRALAAFVARHFPLVDPIGTAQLVEQSLAPVGPADSLRSACLQGGDQTGVGEDGWTAIGRKWGTVGTWSAFASSHRVDLANDPSSFDAASSDSPVPIGMPAIRMGATALVDLLPFAGVGPQVSEVLNALWTSEPSVELQNFQSGIVQRAAEVLEAIAGTPNISNHLEAAASADLLMLVSNPQPQLAQLWGQQISGRRGALSSNSPTAEWLQLGGRVHEARAAADSGWPQAFRLWAPVAGISEEAVRHA